MSKLNDSWKDWFSDVILERGWTYYSSGSILDIEKRDTGYTATVEGSYDYTVDIEIDGGELVDADCSCPYSLDGNYCKHEAAVLYHIENMEEDDYRDMDNENTEEDDSQDADAYIEGLIKKMSEKDVREFLLALALADSSVRKRLFDEYDDVVSRHILEDLGREADRYLYALGNDKNYYDEDRIYSILEELKALIRVDVCKLLKKKSGHYETFSFCREILEEIPYKKLGDWGWDSVGDIETALSDVMGGAYNLANAKEKELIEKEVREKADDLFYEDFLVYKIKDKKLARERLTSHMKELEEAPEWRKPYREVIDLMDVLDYPESDVLAFMKENMHSSKIREMLPLRLYEKGLWQECIELLLKMKAEQGLSTSHKSLLKKIYREHSLKENLKDFLLDEVKNAWKYDLDNIKEVRTLLSDSEWNALCATLKKSELSGKAEFLKYIEDWEGLMTYAEENTGCGIREADFKKLEALFPERVITVYGRMADDVADAMTGSKYYDDYVSWLKKMSFTPEGKRKALEKAEEIRKKCPGRKVLHERLRNAGL